MKGKKVVIIFLALFIFLSLISYAESEEKKSFMALVDVGPLYTKDGDGTHVFGRFGLVWRLIPEAFDLIISGGVAPKLSGDLAKSYFSANFLLCAHFGRTFFGFGAGYNTIETTDEDREQDETAFALIGNVGFDVIKTKSTIGSIFLEGHAPTRWRIGQGGGFSKFYKLMLGFRLQFHF